MKAGSRKVKNWREKNREHVKAYNKIYRADPVHKEAAANRQLQRKYGITLEDKKNLLASQGGKCAACRTPDPGELGWCLDHDHETEKVRGVLCFACNLAIGSAREDIVRLKKCSAYLMRCKGVSIADIALERKQKVACQL
jgi:hypothetical protein